MSTKMREAIENAEIKSSLDQLTDAESVVEILTDKGDISLSQEVMDRLASAMLNMIHTTDVGLQRGYFTGSHYIPLGDFHIKVEFVNNPVPKGIVDQFADAS